jgi:hypothetical protein
VEGGHQMPTIKVTVEIDVPDEKISSGNSQSHGPVAIEGPKSGQEKPTNKPGDWSWLESLVKGLKGWVI